MALIKGWVQSKVDFTRNIMTDSIYTENDQEFQIPETGFQFLNLCREWAILDQKDFYSKYTKLSKTAIKQLASIPVINQQLKNADFPWMPPTAALLDVPSPELLPTPRRRKRRRAATESIDSSNDSFIPPNLNVVRDRRGSFEENTLIGSNPPERIPTPPVTPTSAPFKTAKDLLSKYAVTKIYQRVPNEFSSHRQPCYETAEYHRFSNTFGNEKEEICSELIIKVKHNLAMALECESKANFYYYKMALNLVQLQERMIVDISGFNDLLRQLKIGRR